MKNLKQEFKIEEITVNAIVIHTLKSTDKIKDLLKLKEIENKIVMSKTFYLNKNNDMISPYQIKLEDYPVRLVVLNYSLEEIKTLEDLLKDDLPF